MIAKDRIYRTKTDKTVEVVKYFEHLKSWLCLYNRYTACWYNIDGINQMFDADDPDDYNIDFSKNYSDVEV